MSVKLVLSIPDLYAMKQAGEKISCLTVYDASFSAIIDRVGIELLLVGDSVGMVIQGANNTISVTIEQMIYHCRCVTQTRQRAIVIADLPFLTYSTTEMALLNAAKLMQQGGAQMVKLEGARIEVCQFLVQQGIPVCGHLGLLPQSIHLLGGYKIQGQTPEMANQLIHHAKQLQQAGISLLILECVPATLAKQISEMLTIPVIGIGAGLYCDGQVLVLYDLLGISVGKRPKFAKDFMKNAENIEQAIMNYHLEVKQQLFPTEAHSF